MAFAFPPLGTQLAFDEIIDVRSPSEFALDHIPGAINLPALDDRQRAEVGKIYVQESRFEARKLGAAMVAKNAAHYLETVLRDRPKSWRPLVYCWRGGQRSGSIATILRQIGWTVETLDGGYRSYRGVVQNFLYGPPINHKIFLLDGNTGTAKTEILHKLGQLGCQVLDLEGAARHRGSLFGGFSEAQPSQKAFETQLFEAIGSLDPAQPLIVEAESNKVGDRILPPALWGKMRDARRIIVSAPIEERAKYTVSAYADIARDPEKLTSILNALKPYHAADQIEEWQSLAALEHLEELVRGLMEHHYDPRYRKSADRRRAQSLGEIKLMTLDDAELARAAAEFSMFLAT